VLLVLLFVVACACPGLREGRERSRSGNPKDDSTESGRQKSRSSGDDGREIETNEDKGDFVVVHSGVKNAKYAELDRSFRENRVLENAAINSFNLIGLKEWPAFYMPTILLFSSEKTNYCAFSTNLSNVLTATAVGPFDR